MNGRGGSISFLAPGANKPTRLRASTLGEGFDPEDIRAVIAGERPVPEIHAEAPSPPRRVDFWIDIENRMRSGMGPGYKRWATIHNIKQMAATLQLVRERGLSGYEDLSAKVDEATARFHTLAGELKTAEDELSKTSALMGSYTGVTLGGFVIDESWQENDGLVNTISSKAPIGASAVDYDPEGTAEPHKKKPAHRFRENR